MQGATLADEAAEQMRENGRVHVRLASRSRCANGGVLGYWSTSIRKIRTALSAMLTEFE